MGRYPISNTALPGWLGESTPLMGDELARQEVFDRHGDYVGTVVYVRRQHRRGGSTYGWRPEQASPRAKLTDKVDAIRRLDRFPS